MDSFNVCIEGREGGSSSHFPGNCFFFQIPAQIPQSQPLLLKLKSHSHFSNVFFFMNPSPSAQNPISQPLKKAYPSSHFTHSRPSRNIAFLSEFNCVICLISSTFKLVLCGRIAGGDCLLFKEISFPNFAQ